MPAVGVREELDRAALVEVLADFARSLLGDYTVDGVLDRLTGRVCDVLPVDGAGVMLDDGDGVLRFAAASDETVHQIESLQIELGEGPCLATYATGKRILL